ncbi:MAG: site-specific integrase [Candidatus Schekmanbacteria bacterium]|nr:site-specific integrase [Candidatus Schekmanbacteria bacterium]
MATIGRDKKGYWFVDYTWHGKRKRKSCGCGGDGKRVAEQLLSSVKLDIIQGKLGVVPEISAAQFLHQYLEYAQANKARRSYERDVGIFKNFVPEFQDKNLSQIFAENIEAYKARRLARVGKTTVNRELNTIKAAFAKAVEWGYLVKNPLKAVKKFKEPKSLPRFFSLPEIERILRTAEKAPQFRAAIYLLLMTGMRRDEFLHLEWTDIDLKRNVINIQPKTDWTPKDYEARIIPFGVPVKELLLSLNREGKQIVGCHPTSLSRSFKRILKKIGIENAHLHTLRHTYASHLVMSGVDLPTVQKLLGHSEIKTTMRYAHLAPDHLQEAAKKLGETFCHFSAVEKGETGTKGNKGKVVNLGKSDK